MACTYTCSLRRFETFRLVRVVDLSKLQPSHVEHPTVRLKAGEEDVQTFLPQSIQGLFANKPASKKTNASKCKIDWRKSFFGSIKNKRPISKRLQWKSMGFYTFQPSFGCWLPANSLPEVGVSATIKRNSRCRNSCGQPFLCRMMSHFFKNQTGIAIWLKLIKVTWWMGKATIWFTKVNWS